MSSSTDLSEMLKAKTSKMYINKNLVEKFKNLSLESKREIEEEFPKLRKPKEATMIKMQKMQQSYLRKSEDIQTEILTKPQDEKNISNVPLRQQFLNKKEEIEKSSSNIIKQYELNKIQEQFLDEEPQPITLNKDFDIQSTEQEPKTPTSILDTSELPQNHFESMTYSDWHLVNILYTKIKAHSNGFFANNIPNWYKTTFDKIIPEKWLDIVKKSKKFGIENINTKIVLYTVEDESENPDLDPYASGDMVKNTKCDKTAGIATGFVRYKHLEKSLQSYKHNAGRKVSYKTYDDVPKKPSDILNKSNLPKSNIRYKHLQGPCSNK